MQFFYGEKMPLRVLDEIEFWKQQEAEHTVVIRELAKGLETKFAEALKKWEREFFKTQGAAVRYIEAVIRAGHRFSPFIRQQILGLVAYSLQQSLHFIGFLNLLAEKSEAIKGDRTALVVLQHIRRESEYFVGIAQAVLYRR
ncbi:hypothetical protein BSNK01_17490 [Bacillaceae bacterium]